MPQEMTQEKAAIPMVAQQPRTMMEVIADAVVDPRVDVEKMERLFAMQERVQAREAERLFNIAMNKAQAEMSPIAADARNDQTGSRYASYAKLDRVLRPIYTESGFSLSFDTAPAPEGFVDVLCYASHEAGHTRTYRALVPSDGKGARGGDVMTKTHAFGSGTSYGMRYLLKMIFNIAIGDEDDDGNGAGAEEIERIDEKQAATIRDHIEAVGANEKKLLEWLKVPSIEAIPAHAYDTVITTLKAQEKSRGR